MSSAYAVKLRDPRWQKKRLEILSRDEFTCQKCLDPDSTLHVHHMAYSGRDPWDTPNNLLITLCEACHEFEGATQREAEKDIIISMRSCGLLNEDLFMLAAYFSTERHFNEFEKNKLWLAIKSVVVLTRTDI